MIAWTEELMGRMRGHFEIGKGYVGDLYIGHWRLVLVVDVGVLTPPFQPSHVHIRGEHS